MPALALIGGGGFAKEVAEIARLNGFDIDTYYATEKSPSDLEYGGYLDDLLKHQSRYAGVALAVGAVNRRLIGARRALIDWIKSSGLEAPPLVSPHAVRAHGVTGGAGAFVAHGVILSVDVEIGKFAVVNSAAIVGHDSIIGENATVAPGAFIGGACTVGADSLIGPLAKVLQKVAVGNDVIVGVGCTALRSIPAGATVWPRPDRTTANPGPA